MKNPDLSLLQLKIANIGTALFFCGSNPVLPFGAYIITAQRTDEKGCIWFFISKGWEQPVIYDNTLFPVSLDFYRKGYPFTLKIDGDATLVNDRNIMQDMMGKSIELKEEMFAAVILVKVQIKHSEYKELLDHKPFRPFRQSLDAIKNLLHPFHDKREVSVQLHPAA